MSDDIILSDEDMQETLNSIKEDDSEEELDEHDEEHQDEEGEVEKKSDKDETSAEEEEDVEKEDKTEQSGQDEELSDDEDKESDNEDQTNGSDELIRPPSTWTAEAKSLWAKVPERIRQEVLKREEDIGRGISSYKVRAEYGDRFQQAISPYTPLIQATGRQPEEVVQSLLNTVYRLQTSTPQEKAQLLLQTAQQYGADMSVFKQDIDPAQQQLNSVLTPLQQKIQSLEQQLTSQNQKSEQIQMAEATNQIESFRNAVNEDGTQKYPYFDNVRVKMGSLIEARNEEISYQNSTNGFSNLKPMSLEEAYDEAIWANPETRSLLTATQSQEAEKKRKEAAKKKTAEAKKIDKTNIKSKASHSTKQAKPVGEIDDTMREVLNDIKSRSD